MSFLPLSTLKTACKFRGIVIPKDATAEQLTLALRKEPTSELQIVPQPEQSIQHRTLKTNDILAICDIVIQAHICAGAIQSCFQSAVIIKEELEKRGIPVRIVHGFKILVSPERTMCYRHSWVEIQGLILDAGGIIIEAAVPEFRSLQHYLSTEEPSGIFHYTEHWNEMEQIPHRVISYMDYIASAPNTTKDIARVAALNCEKAYPTAIFAPH